MKLLVLAGTSDGRELAKQLNDRGHEVLLSTVTEYGATIAQAQGINARFGELDEHELSRLLLESRFDAVIDATHPYAQNIQRMARGICARLNLPYRRYQRAEVAVTGEKAYLADDIPQAAELAADLGERILLTTGSRHLEQWKSSPWLKDKQLFIRVLPTSSVLKKCEDLGFTPVQIIAAQGPFSREFNEVIIRDYKIEVLVAKESGPEGGTLAKIEGCQNLNIPIVLLKRPNSGSSHESIEAFIQSFISNKTGPVGILKDTFTHN